MSATLAPGDAVSIAAHPARLSGRGLTLARVVWCVLAGYLIMFFVLGIAPAFEFLRVPCELAACARNYFALLPEQMAALARSGISPEAYAAFMIGTELYRAAVFAGCGLLIFLRRSDEPIALIASLALVVVGVFLSPNTPHSFLLVHPELRPLYAATYIWGNWLFPAMLFLLPDGRFVPRWGRWLLLLWGIASTVAILTIDLNRPPGQWSIWESLSLFSLLACIGAGVVGQVYRYRRIATPQQRQQIKWIGLGLLGMFVGFLVSGLTGVVPVSVGEMPIGWRVLIITASTFLITCFPLALTFAILRYRLWDIDIVLNRALVYGGLTALITVIYFAVVGGLGGLLAGLQGQFVGAVAATAIVLVIVRPLHSRLRAGVNRIIPLPASTTRAKGNPDSDNESHIPRLSRRGLTLARAAWLILAGYPTVMFVIGAVISFEYLRAPCDPSACNQFHWFALRQEQLAELTGVASPATYAIYMTGLEIYQAVVFAGCGLLIFLRRSDEPIALIASLALVVLGVFLIPNNPILTVAPQLAPLISATFIWGNWLFPALLFLLPDGRFVPRWSVWFFLLWGALATYGTLSRYMNPNAGGVIPVEYAAWLVLTISAGIGAYGQVFRYRRVATPQQRQQIKWIALGLLGFGLACLIWAAGPLPAGNGDMPVWQRVLAVTAITLCASSLPIALTFAVLRHRLWDIDVVLNRALVYGALTAFIGAIYVLLVAGLSAVFHTQGSAMVAFVGAGIVAVLFQPLRQRIQRAVNRLMYGQRDEPYAVLARFGQRLEATPTLDTLTTAIVTTIKDTLKLPYVALEVKGQSANDDQATSDKRIAYRVSRITFPLTYQAETVGSLVVAPREGESDLSANDRRLLEDLARQAGVAVHAAGVSAELQRARERLVMTREEERRRLRRDLHDGLGPALAAIAAQSEAARDLIPTQPNVSTSLLTDIVSQSQAATADIRRLVYALRPPALDDLGLVGAIEAQARKISQPDGLQVRVQAEALPPLPAAVEVAAYRIAQEALTNVVRHAQARQCTVTLTMGTGDLRLEIQDDGCGVPPNALAGVGLASMRERAEELGGSFTVILQISGGTLVRACLPRTSQGGLSNAGYIL